jgi:hypothetical protein
MNIHVMVFWVVALCSGVKHDVSEDFAFWDEHYSLYLLLSKHELACVGDMFPFILRNLVLNLF